jgi:hypothetical protein
MIHRGIAGMLHVVKKRQFAPELNQKRINHRFVTFKNTTTTVGVGTRPFEDAPLNFLKTSRALQLCLQHRAAGHGLR